MGLLRHVGTGAVIAALAVAGLDAPVAAQSAEVDLLDDAVEALEAGDEAAYSQAVDLIRVAGIWLPDLGHRALRLRDESDLRLVWLLFESDDIELYELAVSALSLERDAIAFQVPDDEETWAFVQDSDRQAEAIMQMLDHRRIPIPASARRPMELLPSDGSASPPLPIAYEVAIDDFATLATGGTVELSPVPTTTPPVTAETAGAPAVTAAVPSAASAEPTDDQADRSPTESRGPLVSLAISSGAVAVLIGLVAITRFRRPERPNRLTDRRRFDTDLTNEAEFGDRPTALVVVDVDGRPEADEALGSVADSISDSIRRGDVAYRFDRGRFGILLSSTSHRDAIRVAERVHRAIADLCDGTGCGMTVAVGVATGDADRVDDIFDRADDAAAAAKRSGSDEVAVAPLG